MNACNQLWNSRKTSRKQQVKRVRQEENSKELKGFTREQISRSNPCMLQPDGPRVGFLAEIRVIISQADVSGKGRFKPVNCPFLQLPRDRIHCCHLTWEREIEHMRVEGSG